MIVKQILLVTTLGNEKRTVWRLFVLMSACKGSNICLSDKEVTNLNVVYFILTVPFSRWLSKTVSFKVIAICYIPFLAGANIRAKVCFSRDLNWLTFLHLMKKKFHTISNEKYFVADQYQYWKGFFFFKPLNPWEWLASNFSLQYHPWIKCKGDKKTENNHQFWKPLIVK